MNYVSNALREFSDVFEGVSNYLADQEIKKCVRLLEFMSQHANSEKKSQYDEWIKKALITRTVPTECYDIIAIQALWR